MRLATARRRLLAVLGPTNTGKTHLAMERLLGHASGMIGFPLRLLARENYDRAVKLKGANQVALITGEEKIAPPGARYFLCTTEAMPLDRQVSFVAVDEIQMGADSERGHVFTDRLLHARGDETMVLGAESAKPLIRSLVPGAEFVTRPRFSKLTYTGERKITRLPPRSAVVAFSAADVYALAELLRRQRGGAAVVLGALSPRTRNAQVALYQSGEVDYLVATDAIGMGLNMDVDHVAFAALRKFDGRVERPLYATELAQIAGRAGRHMNDGTFGTTGDVGPMDPEMVERVENHRFQALKAFQWRNSDLRFTSLGALMSDLQRRPPTEGLVRVRDAEDELVLQHLSQDAEVADRARQPDAIRLLWDVCRVPDFAKSGTEAHSRFIKRIFLSLTGASGHLSPEWAARQISLADRPEGDIDVLIQRIAQIRTWTYVAFRGDWLADSAEWQARARAVEDRLSDALHDRLTQRFVDRRTAQLMSRMKGRHELLAHIDQAGAVIVAGHYVGHLEGFRFVPDADATSPAAAQVVTAASLRALRREIAARVARLEADPDTAFTVDAFGRVQWQGSAIGRLRKGPDIIHPRIEPMAADLLEGDERDRVIRRLETWFADHIARCLGAVVQALQATLSGPGRGIAFQLAETLGSVPRSRAETAAGSLGRNDRRALAALGVVIGRESLYAPALLSPETIQLRSLLWSVQAGVDTMPVPQAGQVAIRLENGVRADFCETVGYRPLGSVAIRIDMVERLAERAASLAHRGTPIAAAILAALAGCEPGEIADVLGALGYRLTTAEGQVTVRPKRPFAAARGAKRPEPVRPDSPFAKLGELDLKR